MTGRFHTDPLPEASSTRGPLSLRHAVLACAQRRARRRPPAGWLKSDCSSRELAFALSAALGRRVTRSVSGSLLQYRCTAGVTLNESASTAFVLRKCVIGWGAFPPCPLVMWSTAVTLKVKRAHMLCSEMPSAQQGSSVVGAVADLARVVSGVAERGHVVTPLASYVSPRLYFFTLSRKHAGLAGHGASSGAISSCCSSLSFVCTALRE